MYNYIPPSGCPFSQFPSPFPGNLCRKRHIRRIKWSRSPPASIAPRFYLSQHFVFLPRLASTDQHKFHSLCQCLIAYYLPPFFLLPRIPYYLSGFSFSHYTRLLSTLNARLRGSTCFFFFLFRRRDGGSSLNAAASY